MSRHGRIMHCSHCGGSGHNKGGCFYYKNGIDPKLKEGTRIGVQQPVQIEIEDAPVITQDNNIFQPTTIPTESVIASLIHEAQVQQSQPVPTQDPLPECEFLASQVDMSTQRPMPPSQAQIAEAHRLAKQKLLAEKKEAEQTKKLEQAEKKAQEAAEKKQKRAQEAELKRIALAEKRAQEAEIKKIALAEKRAQSDQARKIAVEEKRIAVEPKKAQADEARQKTLAEKRAQAEEAKKKGKSQLNKRPSDTVIMTHAKKISMFDEFRDPPRSHPPADH